MVKNSHQEMDEDSQDADDALSRTILLKVDLRVMPLLTLLLLTSFLDRTNIGNAKILHLTEDIHASPAQYNLGLAIFYLTYILCELPSNLALKRISPRLWIPFLTCVWGVITTSLGFVRSFGSFVAVRALLGLAEGGFFPAVILYLSGLYTRRELALRVGIFYAAASLSGAFGGLLARGLSAIAPRGGLEGWRWVFIIEGLVTVVSGLLALAGLPNSLATAGFLTEEEREHAKRRLQSGPSEQFSWSEVRRAFTSPQLYLTSTTYLAILSGIYSLGLFLPTIVNDMHLTSSPNQTQLWTVIPYAVASPATVAVAFLSDRLALRGIIMLALLPISIVGYAVMASVESAQVRFAMTVLVCLGMYSAVPCVLVWNANNSAGHYKRATTSAMQLAVANCGGFVATFVYPPADGPLYRRGHLIIMGLLCYAWLAVLVNVLWCAKINRDKQLGKYDQHAGSGDDRDPEFKMVL